MSTHQYPLYRKGSTNVIRVGSHGVLIMEVGRQLSAFDVGPCPHEFAGIDRSRTDFAVEFFSLLKRKGRFIQTHFVQRVDENSIMVREYQTYHLEDGRYVLNDPVSGHSHGKVIPLEFICRNEVATAGFKDRIADAHDPLMLERLGVSSVAELEVGALLDNFVECTTKLEKKDRYLSDEEAMQIGGLSQAQFEHCKKLLVWINELLVPQAKNNGVRLKDFKLELALDNFGNIVVVDRLSPDEMRMTDHQDGSSKDKDIFRKYLEDVGFKESVDKARKAGDPLPPYPEIPPGVSAAVTAGYQEAVQQFWA